MAAEWNQEFIYEVDFYNVIRKYNRKVHVDYKKDFGNSHNTPFASVFDLLRLYFIELVPELVHNALLQVSRDFRQVFMGLV